VALAKIVLVASCSLLLATAGLAGPNESANKLFVEAARLWTRAQAKPSATGKDLAARLRLLE